MTIPEHGTLCLLSVTTILMLWQLFLFLLLAGRAAVALQMKRRVAIAGLTPPLFIPWITSAKEQVAWEFSNGSVLFDLPFTVAGRKVETLRFLGSGGGGAVFLGSPISGDRMLASNDPTTTSAVVKVSWAGSAASVQQECRILQRLAANGITEHVEQCLGVQPYALGRTVAYLQPAFLDEQVSSIADIPNPAHQRRAVRALVETAIRMIVQAQVVTTDVQLLIAKDSGHVLWIDFTEAIVLQEPATFTDLAVANGMLNEVAAMVPGDLRSFALDCIVNERNRLVEINQSEYVSELMDNFQNLNQQ